MTEAQFTGNRLLVAIDVAKRHNDVLVLWLNGKHRAFKVANTRDDHMALTRFLNEQGMEVVAALEATADYHRPIAHALAEADIQVHLASSLACARVREAMCNS